MSPTADVQNELAKLRSDLAALREEFDMVVRIARDDDGKVCNSQVRSNFVVAQALVIESESRKMRGMIGSDDDGAFISLLGKDDQTRVMVRVTGNEGTVEIFGDNNERAVHIFADENRQGNVAILSPDGIPRAIMKGMANGGAITAVGRRDSPAPSCIRATTRVKSPSYATRCWRKCLPRKQAVPSALLIRKACELVPLLPGRPAMAFLFTRPVASRPSISRPLRWGSSLSVGHVGEGENQSAAVELHDLPGFGGSIVCRDKSGEIALDLGTAGEGGAINLTNHTDGGSVHLHTNDGGGIVEAARTDSDQRILLTAAKAGALASLMGENETAAFMQMTKNGGSFGIKKGNHMQGFVGVTEDGESGTIMLTNADNTNSVNLAASKQGGRIILGSDDGTAQRASSPLK
ncbi:MAG: hypothetical protein H0X34_07860 [Chthoniobacterales bacterium]|nr:hypothetical protein [Chthoniobacterales bacterium]